MYDTVLTLSGNVAADLVQRETSAGPVTKLRLAHSERRQRNGVWEDGDTMFITVSCWRTLGANVFASVHRGDPIIVRGRLRVNNWEQEGQPRMSLEMDAMSVGHDLNRGVATFQRARTPASAPAVTTSTDDPWAAPLAAEASAAGLRPDSAVEALSEGAAA